MKAARWQDTPPVNQLHVWWYACHRNRSRPRKVLAALELMYA